MNEFEFSPLSENDLELLYQWFQEPTIKQWYARGQHFSPEDISNKYSPRILGKENVPSFIVYRNDSPIGFIQYYLVAEHFLQHPLSKDPLSRNNPLFKQYSPTEVAGVDCFIAHNNDRGNGLGERLIHAFILQFMMNFCAIIVDPDQHNKRAIRCYEKCGFQYTSFSEDMDYLIMTKVLHPTNKIK